VFTTNGDQQVHARDSAFNTDQLLNGIAFAPTIDYNLIQIIPPTTPVPPATQVINYIRQAPLPAPLGIIRQLTILYDAAGNIDTITRAI